METCNICNRSFSKNGIGTHKWRSHGKGINHKPTKGKIAWNRGLTKETSEIMKRIGEQSSVRLKGIPKGPLPEKTRKKVSQSMKLAHKEGRAWNIGKSRWNNEESYAEKFFAKVIQNEFDDKNYEREYPVGIYAIDFAWVDKKLAIEIDGAQHQRFDEYKERDKRKDKHLTNNGWQILRISWADFMSDTKLSIEKAKGFVDN